MGYVASSRATLSVLGDFDPALISELLGCEPASTFRHGDPVSSRGLASARHRDHDGWKCEVEVHAPNGPEEAITRLFSQMPENPDVWSRLHERYAVRLWLMLWNEDENTGFELSPQTSAAIAARNLTVSYDIYAFGADEPAAETSAEDRQRPP